MDASPLTQQNRPGSFQPKIHLLYEQLFEAHDDAESDFDDGFWREFFLLRPDKANLRRLLEHTSVDDLLQIQGATQLLFRQAVARINSGNGGADESALDTLTVFLNIVLAKRYTNPSSEIIALLAGLDQVDTCFLHFVDAIESVIRLGGSAEIRQKAVEVAIALTAGAYQTSLVSYFTHRDLFPSLMTNIDNPHHGLRPILLLGLLANYNKFELRNPYRSRFEDFVNNAAIQKIILAIGSVCSRSRDLYVAIQEDIEEGWTLSNTLKYIGLGVLAPSRSSTPTRNAPGINDSKELFSTLPETDACILLPIYDFTNANKLFANTFITHPVDTPNNETPFSAFLSLTSYILHHAYRSPRSTLYGHLNLITIRILLEDQSLCTKIFSPDFSIAVRLCRQRPPFLPKTSTLRPLAATLFDIAIDTITHNLRRRLSVPLYIATLNIIHRLLSYLLMTRTRFSYHWPLLWQTLLSLLRFLTTYADAIRHDPDLPALIDLFLAVLSLAVCSGEIFLPNNEVYDDLFYKIVENGHLLPRFKSAFSHLSRPSTVTPTTMDPHASASPTTLIDTLTIVSDHFTSLLEEEKGKSSTFSSGTKNLSPKEVSRVIRKGYESLRVPETVGLERWVRWREVDEKGLVKKAGRQAVEDARRLVGS
ncbi:MAG: hypothetical protein L6R36_002595 [Xanthoria steineri]|nr:MAG: hypothetical protein L6R36_002595 [Xanthoria steineri]